MPNLPELDKQRDIVFDTQPEGQIERARKFLGGLPGCQAEPGDTPDTLRVSYNLLQHTLETLENRLTEEGFLLDRSMLRNIERNIIYYCEDTLCHNMDVPMHPTKKNERDVFVKAYEHEPHGDLDATPAELRDFK